MRLLCLQLRDIEILCQTPGLQSDKVQSSALLTLADAAVSVSCEWQRPCVYGVV
jgi:hypothetical protein